MTQEALPQVVDRLPPHNTEMEATLLGCFMSDNAVIADCLASHPQLGDYFYDLRNDKVFGAIKSLADAETQVDVVTVADLLTKRGELESVALEYVATLPDNVHSPAAAEDYAEQLRDLYIKRKLLIACHRVQVDVYGEAPAAVLMETLEGELTRTCNNNASREAPIKELVQSAIAEIEAAHQNGGKNQGLETGFADLDGLTHGLRPGQVFVVGARPGVGKTSLALNIATHVAIDLKHPVGFFSLEMCGAELTLRLLSSRSAVPLDRLQTGQLTEEHFRRVTVATAAISNAPLHIVDEEGITVAQLRAKARRLHRKHRLALVVVDYLQLLRPNRNNASRTVEVSELSSSLKALAKELALPVIVLSQLNRDSETEQREPRLRDLRYSGSIEQDADIVGLLHRPDPEQRPVTLHIAKHRQGAQRRIDLMFFGETFTFRQAEYRE